MSAKKLLATIIALTLIAITLLSGCAARPGTLPDPKTLPKADRSDVGTTVTVSMDALVSEQPGDIKSVVFAYVYNGTDQSGRLAVFTHYEHEKPVSLLTVYEPELSSVDGILSAIKDGFQAKIVDRAIVSAEENRRLHMVSYRVSNNTQLKESEIISSSDAMPPAGDGMYYYFGCISNQQNDPKCCEMQTGNYIMLVGNTENLAGESIATAIDNLKLTAKRFLLEESLGI